MGAVLSCGRTPVLKAALSDLGRAVEPREHTARYFGIRQSLHGPRMYGRDSSRGAAHIALSSRTRVEYVSVWGEEVRVALPANVESVNVEVGATVAVSLGDGRPCWR